jgi:disulfide bond formation protein DsbB
MDTYTVSQALAAAALVAAGFALVCAALVALAAGWRRARTAVVKLATVAPFAATSVAVTMTAGSLYFSEVAGFIPCELCWYQRICAYPLAMIGVVALIRRDRGAWFYAVPLAAVGLAVSLYHAAIQAWPDLSAGTCSPTAPCTDRHVWLWGFVSIPAMAAAGFAAILAAALIAATGTRWARLTAEVEQGPSES